MPPLSRSALCAEHFGVDDMNRAAFREGIDLVENIAELGLVILPRDIADMRRAKRIVQEKKREIAIINRLCFENVHGRHAWPSLEERSGERSRLDECGPARIHEEGFGFH